MPADIDDHELTTTRRTVQSFEMLQASPAAQWPAAPGEADARCGLPLARVKQALARFGDGRPALVIDVARVRYNARRFAAAMPSVRPHYAVKANSDRRVLQALAQQGVGFEIASSTELDLVRSIGVPAAEILYSNPVRATDAIEYAARRGCRVVRHRLRAGARQVRRIEARRQAVPADRDEQRGLGLAVERQVRRRRSRQSIRSSRKPSG